jgi:hypothetical protein
MNVDLKPEGDKAGETLYGDCDSATRIIRIEKSSDDELCKRILKHEKMHMKLGLSGLTEILTSEQEEAICVLAETD